MDCRVKIPSVIDREVLLPQSKSVVARALIINALCGEAWRVDDGRYSEITGHGPIVSFCDDTEILAKALASNGDHIDVGAAGTAMRFLTAFFACQDNRTVVLDGTERMRRRPIGLLVDALRQMGASIEYLGDEGCPPLKIEGHRLHGGTLTMRGDVSSQFVSALMMIAPLAGGITLTLEGDIVSRPYIDMTLAMMRHYGIRGSESGDRCSSIFVPAGNYAPVPLEVEGDWSAAGYWFALKALLPESRIVLSPLFEDSLQGDRAIVEMMAPLGVECAFADDSVVLASNGGASSPSKIEEAGGSMTEAHGVYERDMAATPDLVPTLAVTLCLLRVPYVLTGVATLRIKESDRLAALREELAKLGYGVEVGADSLSYNGNRTETAGEVALSPHGDHRMAMALSLAATRHNIVIKDAEVVSKSYPNWWQQLINA